MIHQFIFAGPKPNLPADAFQSYWLNFHAVEYAAKIPQIRQYLVATRRQRTEGPEAPFFEGVAEIWLDNDADQLASLQTREFLEGARVDEPRWAAFWRTFVLDTDSRVLWHDEEAGGDRECTKLYALLKRPAAVSLDEFRRALGESHAALVAQIPGLKRHLVGIARDNQYGFGEPRFDAIDVLTFDSFDDVIRAGRTPAYAAVEASWRSIASTRFTFVGDEHWIIRPGQR